MVEGSRTALSSHLLNQPLQFIDRLIKFFLVLKRWKIILDKKQGQKHDNGSAVSSS